MRELFSPGETRALAAALDAGRPLTCPRCATLLDRRPVPPRRDVSYVRDRLWLVCPLCQATGFLDRRETP
ncbi:MAG TPA: hypothetical protein VLH75_08455 [Longimicrobiales bacterium]|nr:hypothetical protein [Longimicrobiales bacterium]